MSTPRTYMVIAADPNNECRKKFHDVQEALQEGMKSVKDGEVRCIVQVLYVLKPAHTVEIIQLGRCDETPTPVASPKETAHAI